MHKSNSKDSISILDDAPFDPLLTVTQLAKILAVSTSLIYKWVEVGVIPHYRFGKAIRFDFTQIIEWLNVKSLPKLRSSEEEGEKKKSLNNSNCQLLDNRPTPTSKTKRNYRFQPAIAHTDQFSIGSPGERNIQPVTSTVNTSS